MARLRMMKPGWAVEHEIKKFEDEFLEHSMATPKSPHVDYLRGVLKALYWVAGRSNEIC